MSHGDVIKAILADALGTHLDQFQRIHVDPAAVSVIRYPVGRPMVLGMNGSGTDLAGLVPAEATETTDTSDANDGGETNVARDTGDEGVVGGGAGRAG